MVMASYSLAGYWYVLFLIDVIFFLNKPAISWYSYQTDLMNIFLLIVNLETQVAWPTVEYHSTFICRKLRRLVQLSRSDRLYRNGTASKTSPYMVPYVNYSDQILKLLYTYLAHFK